MKTNNRLQMTADARQQSRDTVLKRLTVFDSLRQHAVSRFSKENLYNLLRFVASWAQADENATVKQTRKISFKLRSIRQLTDIVTSIRRSKSSSKAANEPTLKHCDRFINDIKHLKDLYKYFSEEVYQCLLTNHYDPSVERSENNNAGRTGPNFTEDDDSGVGSQAETDDASRMPNNSNKRRKERLLLSQHDLVNAQSDSDKRYKAAVNELRNMLKTWKGLLSEDELDLNGFDPESYHELMEFVNYSQFEIILRLVPDMFLKCTKCIQLAKVWLQEADIVLADNHKPVLPIVMETPPTPIVKNRETPGSPNLNKGTQCPPNHKGETQSSPNHNRKTPLSLNNNSNKTNSKRTSNSNNNGRSISQSNNTGRKSGLREERRTPKSDRATRMSDHDTGIISPNNNSGHVSVNGLEKEISEISYHVSDIEKSIDEEEKELAKYKDEMENLHNRDEHFDDVSSDFSKLDTRLSTTASEYYKLKTQQLSVTSRLRSCSKSSTRYSDLKEQSRRLDSAVAQLHWNMKLLEYERAMVQEDYLVEMEVRPSFIRFQGDIRERIEGAQQALQSKKYEKLKLEKQVELLRTNTDRMRKLMDAHHVNEDTCIQSRSGLPSDDIYNGQFSATSTPSSVQSADLDIAFSDVFVDDGNEADTDSTAPYNKSPRIARRSRGVTTDAHVKAPSVMSEKTTTITEESPRGKHRHNSFHTDMKPGTNVPSSDTRRLSVLWDMQPYVNVLAQTHGRRSNGPRQGRRQSDKSRQAWER